MAISKIRKTTSKIIDFIGLTLITILGYLAYIIYRKVEGKPKGGASNGNS